MRTWETWDLAQFKLVKAFSLFFIYKEAGLVPGLSSGPDPTFRKVIFALLTEGQKYRKPCLYFCNL